MTCCWTRSRRSPTWPGDCVCVGSAGPRPGLRRTLRRRVRRTRASATACTSRDRGPVPRWTAATPPRTCWCWPRAPRPTAWSSPRRWPVACRSSPPTSAGCGGPRTRRRRDPAGAARPAGRSGGARRGPARLAGRRRAARAAAPGRPRAARVAARVAGHRRHHRRRPGRGVAMSADPIRVSPGWLALREPTDAAARARDLAEHLAPAPGGRPLGDPRPRRRHRRDGPLADAAAARAPALGCPRPRRRPARARRRHAPRARPPTGPRSPSRRGAPTSSAWIRARSRAPPHHRLGAAGHAHRDEVTELVSLCAGAGMPGPAGAFGHRPRRHRPRRSRSIAASPLPSTPTSAATTERGALLGPDAAAFAADAFRRREPRCSCVTARGGSARAAAELTAQWFSGWVGAACEQRGRWRPRPVTTHAAGWRRRRPGTSRSRWATPTSWCCRGRRLDSPADSGRSRACAPRCAFVAR